MRLNQKDILEIVPIRKPMLCIDEICEVDYGNYVEGYRNIEVRIFPADLYGCFL